MAKHNQKGRTTKQRCFVMLRHDMLQSPAYRALKPTPRAVYTEILHRYNGINNGEIPLSCREAADRCNISQGTAARAFKKLQEHGFIKIGRASGFNMKKRESTRWIITHEAIGGKIGPTDEWKDWIPPSKDTSPQQDGHTMGTVPLIKRPDVRAAHA